MQEEDFHRQIVMELTLGRPLPSLWAKVISEAKGDKAYAKALYLRYRMDSLKALFVDRYDPSAQHFRKLHGLVVSRNRGVCSTTAFAFELFHCLMTYLYQVF